MDTTTAAAPRTGGRGMMWLGVAAALLGIAAYALQFYAQRLFAPWYMPVLASVGVLMAALSLLRTRSVWRVLALVFVLLLAGAEWALLLGLRLPAYSGPVTVGKSMPAFKTMRADGTPFTQSDLPGAQNSVLVFFRGRW